MIRFLFCFTLATVVMTGPIPKITAQTSNEELQTKIDQLQDQLKKVQTKEKSLLRQLEETKKQQEIWKHQSVKLEVTGKLEIQVICTASIPQHCSYTYRVWAKNTIWQLEFQDREDIQTMLRKIPNGSRVTVKGNLKSWQAIPKYDLSQRNNIMPANPISHRLGTGNRLIPPPVPINPFSEPKRVKSEYVIGHLQVEMLEILQKNNAPRNLKSPRPIPRY